MSDFRITVLPAFSDNYLFVIHDDVRAVAVDPGVASVIMDFLRTSKLRLEKILITHHHPDHIGGVNALKEATGCEVYCSKLDLERGTVRSADVSLGAGDKVILPWLSFEVIAVPGHTLPHIVYHSAAHKLLFCGDVLFPFGCGRIFEGTPEQMYESLQSIRSLPADTKVYCAHEYARTNLSFLCEVFAENSVLNSALQTLQEPTVPFLLSEQVKMNPFLCPESSWVLDGMKTNLPVEAFARLRKRKDQW